jgi:type IV fimbrial biogenesis protein FimT
MQGNNGSSIRNNPNPQQQRGVSMVEACIVVAIAGILAGTALPSFKDQLDKRSIEGKSAEVRTDLMFARSEAVARNEGVRVSFYDGAGGRCYVVHTGSRADCSCDGTGPAVCTGGAVALKTVNPSGGVQVVANVSSLRFDPTNGTTAPAGTVCTVPDRGRSLHHVVSITGRFRSCAPATAGAPCAPC